MLRRSRGVQGATEAVLLALPADEPVTDRAVDLAFARAAAAVADEAASRHAAAWPALSDKLAGVSLLTEPLRTLLRRCEPQADAVLDHLVALGWAERAERAGEPVILLAELPFVTSSCERGAEEAGRWTATVRSEYARIGADHELAADLADAGAHNELRTHLRRRYPELLRDAPRLAGVLAALPADEVCGDPWLVVVERLCAEATGSPAVPRRVRRPVAAMAPLDRCWLQAGRVRLEMADGSFTKAVAEAKALSRLLDQVDAPDDEAAELWLQSALPLVHTGDHAGAAHRLRGAAALAIAADRPHVEAQATGLIALSAALRGDLAVAAQALAALPANADDAWLVPAQLARSLVLVEAGLADQATDVLAEVDATGAGAFWAVRGAIGTRVALQRATAADGAVDASAPGRALDGLGLAEQLHTSTVASNHDRGLLAAGVALLQLAVGRPALACAALTGFDDGRETTACARALIDLAEGRRQDAAAVVERLDARRLLPVTIVEAAALRALSAPDEAARRAALGRAVAIAGRCGLSRRAEQILRLGSR
ncbi:hypothetical protein P5G50_16725 [Leifsonia sp. F6_8S_P_1B]|uniref:Uncharacterized protein n=1 Tax=Leifsonia williamsii TaxID=3035919 RepID=A0ABT8KGH3_9MICO|nr:hypothetical protein [Leifsonia williamsii]MDN4616093.1 hypothetical protein [Leifsonia williamsii]